MAEEATYHSQETVTGLSGTGWTHCWQGDCFTLVCAWSDGFSGFLQKWTKKRKYGHGPGNQNQHFFPQKNNFEKNGKNIFLKIERRMMIDALRKQVPKRRLRLPLDC